MIPFIDELNTHTIKTIIHEMQLEKMKAGVFFHPSLPELYKAFKKIYADNGWRWIGSK
jgi:hypothetical protein